MVFIKLKYGEGNVIFMTIVKKQRMKKESDGKSMCHIQEKFSKREFFFDTSA